MDSLPRLAPRLAQEEGKLLSATAVPSNSPDETTVRPLSIPSNQRGHRNPRITSEQWERIKQPFTLLYRDQGQPLKDVMNILETEHSFTATRNQFNFMIKKWKLDKNVKGSKMRHIVKIRNQRLQQDPNKQTIFHLRHMPVEETKIRRFEQEHPSIPVPSSRTPTDISWRSPTPVVHTPSEDAWMKLIEWSPSSPRSKISGPSKPPSAPGIGCRLELSRLSSRSLTPQQLDTFLRHFSPEQSPVTALSPSLQHFDWWRPYGTYHVKQETSMVKYPSLSNILREIVTFVDTYEAEMINQMKSSEFEIIIAEGADQDLVFNEGPDDCPDCTLRGFMNFLLPVEEILSATYQLDWQWCVSEIAKAVFEICVSSTDNSGSEMKNAISLVSELTRHCLMWGLCGDANTIVQAAITFQDLAPPKDTEVKNEYLCLVGYAIFAEDLEIAEALLRKTIGQDFGKLAERDLQIVREEETEEEEHGPTNEPEYRLLNRAASQLNIIQWFQSRPDVAKRVFYYSETPDGHGICCGIKIRSETYCIHYHRCHEHEETIYQDLWDKILESGDIIEVSSNDEDVLNSAVTSPRTGQRLSVSNGRFGETSDPPDEIVPEADGLEAVYTPIDMS